MANICKDCDMEHMGCLNKDNAWMSGSCDQKTVKGVPVN